MPALSLSHTIDSERNRIYITVRGRYESRELFQALMRYYATIENAFLRDRLIDVRRADGYFSLDEIKAAAGAALAAARTASTGAPQARVAFVSNDPFDAPRLSGLADLLPSSRYRSFDSMRAAEDWLDQPPE
ncbi:MAG: hypothetical protein QM667_07155 [Asticcacaulis sp.]